ncbi:MULTISPECIES: MFS transporter [Prauserella salsuginis group]|uniref:MFS transporter n=1 Tax=Prauserella salsuginis TaxID=387889 RepID=A0ABW6G9R3_9PSEU|nr:MULTISPECIES: MFS transporter [Prauserella salsuginis group]MCR3721450.1 putative arabinose efflux permease, MFS family [Prauserella flava]MCR3732440.1 putative arabinose efflux permease, MFS family [Prauserella salsuginis]
MTATPPREPAPNPVGLTAPLRLPDFRNLFVGRTFDEFANALAPVALAFAVLDLTGSPIQLGLVVGARSLANVAFLLLAGVLADRFPRAVILQGTGAAAALTQAAIAASVLCGFANVPLLVALSVANGAVAAISLPAAAALTPQTVPSSLLTQANALVRAAANAGRIGGAALGGLLVAVSGPGWTLGMNAALFALSAVAYHGVHAPAAGDGSRSSPLRELAEGWREFTARRWVWLVVLQFMVVNAVVSGGLVVLGPMIADEGIGRSGWGLVLAAQTAGAFAGGFLAARWRPSHALRIGVGVTLAEAVPLVFLAHLPELVPLMAVMFLAGMAVEQFTIAWDVSLQENIPPDRLARVYSYDMLGSFIALPVGEMAAGPLAAQFGRPATLVGGAVLVAVVTLVTLTSKQVRTLERLPES